MERRNILKVGDPSEQEIDRQALLKAYHLVNTCGKVHEARAFAINVMDELNHICPYDQGRIYFYNENGNICDQHLVNIDPNLVNQYHVYYSMVDEGRYSIPLSRKKNQFRERREIPKYTPGSNRHFISEFHVPLSGQTLWLFDWEKAPPDEFVKDYIQYIHLRYSTGFAVFDVDDTLRILFMMDRTCRVPYSKQELIPLGLAIPMLEHLYQNLTAHLHKPRGISAESYALLTTREKEIVEMLCRGMSSKSICEKAKISSATLYTHNAHIFKKLGISSRQELIAKMIHTDMD